MAVPRLDRCNKRCGRSLAMFHFACTTVTHRVGLVAWKSGSLGPDVVAGEQRGHAFVARDPDPSRPRTRLEIVRDVKSLADVLGGPNRVRPVRRNPEEVDPHP